MFGKPLVEQYESIDVRSLARRRVLVPGDLTVLQHGQDIVVTWTPCNYGGARPWFLCPACRRRATLLYAPHLLCRTCCGLAYGSQYEDATERAWRRVARLRERLHALGIDPERPCYRPPLRVMRAKRCSRLLNEYAEAVQRANTAWHKTALALIGRAGLV